MHHQDHILRISAANDSIRAFFADTKKTVNIAADIHNATAVVSAALGRLLTVSAIMGLTLKNDGDLLTISIKGNGSVGSLLVTSDSKGRVKGYVDNPGADIPNKVNGKLDVSGVIGRGTLTVIKDMGVREPYNGTVLLQTSEIAEDIAYYFAQSEQIASAVSLGVLVDIDYSIKQAGGFVIQLMPGASEDVISYLEKKLDGIDSITNLFEQGHTTESLAEMLFAGVEFKVLDKVPVKFFCNCSQERVEKALISIGKHELEKIIEEDKSAFLKCHFCNKSYHFDEKYLRKLACLQGKS